jgi:hypothetical protein
MRRSVSGVVLAVVFGIAALSAWREAAVDAFGDSGVPAMLVALQTITGVAAAATAWGSWVGARWAPVAAVSYGVIAAGMILALGPMLDLSAEDRSGLWTGALAVLVFTLVCAWWLRRSIRRRDAHESASVVS